MYYHMFHMMCAFINFYIHKMIIICTHNVEEKNNERSKFLHCIKQKKKCMMLVLSSTCVIKETIITSCTYLLIKKIVVQKFVYGMDFVLIYRTNIIIIINKSEAHLIVNTKGGMKCLHFNNVLSSLQLTTASCQLLLNKISSSFFLLFIRKSFKTRYVD